MAFFLVFFPLSRGAEEWRLAKTKEEGEAGKVRHSSQLGWAAWRRVVNWVGLSN
jgi:hypothetical protein